MKRGKWAVVLIVTALVLAGCDLGPSITSGLSSAPIPTLAPATQTASSRPHLVIQFCNDDTGSYPRTYFIQANQLIASALTQSVTANQQGVTLFATAITHDTFNPAYTLYPALAVPQEAAYPVPPTPIPTPTPSDPVTDTSARASVNKTNVQNATDFNTQVAQLNAQIQADQSAVSHDVKRLLTWSPKVDHTATSIFGCFELASENLHTEAGLKLLYIASDLENNTDLDYTSSLVTSHQLKGVVVHVLFLYSTSAPQDLQKRAQWCAYLKAAGATAVLFNNQVTSLTLMHTDMFSYDSSLPTQSC